MRTPMDAAVFIESKKAFEEKGGMMIQDENGDKYLDACGANAATLNDKTIIFRTGSPPTLSEYHEELIHVSQFERGIVSSASILECEIEAKEELIRNQAAYGIPDHENEETKRQLRDLLELLGRER